MNNLSTSFIDQEFDVISRDNKKGKIMINLLSTKGSIWKYFLPHFIKIKWKNMTDIQAHLIKSSRFPRINTNFYDKLEDFLIIGIFKVDVW